MFLSRTSAFKRFIEGLDLSYHLLSRMCGGGPTVYVHLAKSIICNEILEPLRGECLIVWRVD
jgi:hypothetical protein